MSSLSEGSWVLQGDDANPLPVLAVGRLRDVQGEVVRAKAITEQASCTPPPGQCPQIRCPTRAAYLHLAVRTVDQYGVRAVRLVPHPRSHLHLGVAHPLMMLQPL